MRFSRVLWWTRITHIQCSRHLNTMTWGRPLSKAPNPQLLPGCCSIGCPLLWVCVHSMCVCVFTALCVHLDGTSHYFTFTFINVFTVTFYKFNASCTWTSENMPITFLCLQVSLTFLQCHAFNLNQNTIVIFPWLLLSQNKAKPFSFHMLKQLAYFN